ncbi:MAG: DUF4129 domain-containing protein, partial [Gemmataceae bacterium]
YLRQRRLQMPPGITAMWLGVGCAMIGSLLVVAAVLPRPYSENALWSGWKVHSQKRQASTWAVQGDSPAEGKASPGQAQDKKGDPANKANKNGEPGKDGKVGKDRDSKSEKGQTANKDSKAKKDQTTDRNGKSGNQSDPSKKQPDPSRKQPHDANSRPSSPPPPSSATQNLMSLAQWLKWLVFAALIVAVLYLLIRHGLAFFARFSDAAKGWLAWWRGLVGPSGSGSAADDEPSDADAHTPFAAFPDPFVSGQAGGWTPRQLVRYSFAALEAWARDQGLQRATAETAQEFIARLSAEYPELARQAQALLRIYTLAEYSPQELPADSEALLRAFWQQLNRATRTRVSV